MSPTEQNARSLLQNARGREAPSGSDCQGRKAAERGYGFRTPKKGPRKLRVLSTRRGRTGAGG